MTSARLITRKVWLLSLVSLFTDFASEMLYPVMPVYLKSIGYSVLLIGFLEGFAEAVAGMSKIYFGRLSDVSNRRLIFIQIGYALSAISKPMLALSTQVWWIFSSRLLDRAGKGLRTAPRDAMLSNEATQETKASVFGFHRMMDTFGAFLGPLVALLFLNYYPNRYASLFLLAFLPGFAAIILTFFLKEKTNGGTSKKAVSIKQLFGYWKIAPANYKKLLFALLLFGIFNSSDVFLLLQMREWGMSDTGVIGMYIFYNLVFAVMAFPAGKLADRIGLKKVFLLGLFFFVVTYFGFAIANRPVSFAILLITYGLYAACTEGVAKAWISRLVPAGETASAIGLFAGLNSITALFASTAAGFIWFHASPQWVFYSGAAMALLSFTSILVLFRSR